jgi:Fe-S-cluster containining protein
MATPPPDLTALCLSCGMCCNGALFDFATLGADELDHARALGFEVVEIAGEPAFMQPCPQLSGTSCTVYDRPAPAACRKYFCKLAKGVQAGNIAMVEAAGRVASAKDLVAALVPHLEPGESLIAARRRFGHLTATGALGTAPRFAIAMAGLIRHLDRHFRKDGKALMTPVEE